MKVLDLSKLTPEKAAKELYDWCVTKASDIGQKPEIEVALWSPEEADQKGYGKAWMVCWEAGPHEWATRLSLGGSAFELGYAYRNPPEVILTGAEKFCAEPYYSFNISFYNT